MQIKSISLLALVALLGFGTAVADVLDKVKARGELVVGTRADYRPFGYLDAAGNLVGIEPELARDVAKRLGVTVKFEPVISSNRMQFLQQGRIDLMIATMTDTEERRKAVRIVEPNYYSSGTNILAPKSVRFKQWTDLKGRPVCGVQGAFYNRKTQEEFGANVIAFTGTAEVLTALKQGRCVAFVYDDAFIGARLQESEWADYEQPLPTIDDKPWGLAVAPGEERFAALLADTIKDWHKSGKIVELEKKFGVTPTAYTLRQNKEFSK